MKPLLTLLSVCALLTGCAGTPVFQTTPVVETITNTVYVVETVTNTVGVVETVTNLVQVPVNITNTVYTVNTQWVAGVQMVRDTGAAVAVAAPPAAPIVGIVDGILGLSLTLLGAFAAIKTRLAKKNATALDTTQAMLRAVVAGVETANQPAVKEAITHHASILKVSQALDTVVQSVTKEIPK